MVCSRPGHRRVGQVRLGTSAMRRRGTLAGGHLARSGALWPHSSAHGFSSPGFRVRCSGRAEGVLKHRELLGGPGGEPSRACLYAYVIKEVAGVDRDAETLGTCALCAQAVQYVRYHAHNAHHHRLVVLEEAIEESWQLTSEQGSLWGRQGTVGGRLRSAPFTWLHLGYPT